MQPKSTYIFYFLSSIDKKRNKKYICAQILPKYNIQYILPTWKIDMFFNEKIIPPNVLEILLNHLNGMKNIMGILRNIFDGRQVASYIRIIPFLLNMKEINDSIH